MSKSRTLSIIVISTLSLSLIGCAQQSTTDVAVETELIATIAPTTAVPTQTLEATPPPTLEATIEDIGVDNNTIIAWAVPASIAYSIEETGAGPAISFAVADSFDNVYAMYNSKIIENGYAFATGKEAEVVEEKIENSKSKRKMTSFWIIKQEQNDIEERVYVQLFENDDKTGVDCIFTLYAVNPEMFGQINDIQESPEITSTSQETVAETTT